MAMWKLYDDLGIGIPSGIRITGCVVGEKWTIVRADGNIGLARTLEYPENAAEFAAAYVGTHLRDAANHMRWSSLAKASVGVAAMNAWYNRKARAEGLNGNQEPMELEGKTACVGFSADCCKGCDDCFPLPLSPDFDRAAYAKIASYDNVIIAAETLMTRALPALLELAGDGANVILTGESLPASALFFAFGMPVRELRGFYAINPETVEACALSGIDPAPGITSFCVRPIPPKKLHESPKAAKALNSPYRAVKFNNNFK